MKDTQNEWKRDKEGKNKWYQENALLVSRYTEMKICVRSCREEWSNSSEFILLYIRSLVAEYVSALIINIS